MNPWIEALAVALLAFGGYLLGCWFSRLPKPYWTFGYFIPLVLVLVYGAARRFPALVFVTPISWMMMGRTKFAIIGFICALILTVPTLRLPDRRTRLMLYLLMSIMTGITSVWPFLAPAFNRSYLASLQTTIDSNGVCRQSNNYNCGPAAAVTALRKLGFPAEEGEIAILAYASAATGTEPDMLARKLQQHYGKDGLIAEYRLFKNIQELRGHLPTLAVIKFNFLTDHFVTVLDVNETEVTLGDPLIGISILSLAEFEAKWRFSGITLQRK